MFVPGMLKSLDKFIKYDYCLYIQLSCLLKLILGLSES